MIYKIKAPAKYLQQCGAMEDLFNILDTSFDFTKKFIILLSERSEKLYCPIWLENSTGTFLEVCYIIVGENDNEVTVLNNVKETFDPHDNLVIVGVGGGRILDITKYVSNDYHCVLVPTMFSGDAACTSMSVLKAPGTTINNMVYRMQNSIDLVIVDPEVIVTTPPKYFLAGLGDILSTYYECLASMYAGNITMAHGDHLPITRDLAESLIEHLYTMDYKKILECFETLKVSESLEKFLYYAFYISGYLSENGGIGIAHAFSAAYDTIRPNNGIPHGSKVAVGLALMMAYTEGMDLFPFRDYRDTVYYDILPKKISDLGADPLDDEYVNTLAYFISTNKYVNGDPAKFTELIRREINF